MSIIGILYVWPLVMNVILVVHCNYIYLKTSRYIALASVVPRLFHHYRFKEFENAKMDPEWCFAVTIEL